MNLAGVLRGHLRIARNSLWPRAGSAKRRVRGFVATVAVVFFAGFFFVSAAALFEQLQSIGLGDRHAGAALGFLFASAMAALLLFDLHHAVSNLLLASDLELLRRAPLSGPSFLLLKLLDSVPRTAAAVIVVALPAALAFTIRHPLPFWGWWLLPIQLGSLWAIPLGLGIAGGLLLVNVVPARRARDALGLLTTLVLVGMWLANSFLLPRIALEGSHLVEQLRRLLTTPPWLIQTSPAHWAAGAMAAAARGDAREALLRTAELASAGGLSLAIATAASRAWLDEALARVVRTTRGSRVLARGGWMPRSGIGALILKDARLFLRDWTVLGDVLTAALLWTVLPLVATPIREAPALVTGRVMLMALTVGLGYEVGSRAVPFEREALAWSLLAPIAPHRWNLIKLAGAAAVSLPIVVAAAVAIRLALPLDFPDWLQLVAAALSALAVALSLGLWTGWTFGDAAWTNPRAMLTLGGRLVASFLMLLQAGTWLALLALADTFRGYLPAAFVWWAPPLIALATSLLVLAAANQRMRQYQWKG